MHDKHTKPRFQRCAFLLFVLANQCNDVDMRDRSARWLVVEVIMKSDCSVVIEAAMRAAYTASSDPVVVQLEALRPGSRLQSKDGTPFIRTNRTCICFCNLRTGALCSARDIFYRYGGIDEQTLRCAPREMDHDHAA